MLLTITTTQPPATELSRLLVADPDDVRTRRFPFGEALVFFPQHDSARCTAAVLVQPKAAELASPLSSLAIVLGTVFEAAILGGGPERGSNGTSCRLLEVQTPTLVGPAGQSDGDREGERAGCARRLFAPLGYDLEVGADASLWLSATTDLAALLVQLCVLLPVLEDAPLPEGHDRIEWLLLDAAPWLATHPEQPLIARRYRGLDQAMERDQAPSSLPRHRTSSPRHCTRHISTG